MTRPIESARVATAEQAAKDILEKLHGLDHSSALGALTGALSAVVLQLDASIQERIVQTVSRNLHTTVQDFKSGRLSLQRLH